jgi:hypothetical protein
MKPQETLLQKGAISRIVQEIYYICDSKGNKKINRALTLKRFDQKLGQIIQEDI